MNDHVARLRSRSESRAISEGPGCNPALRLMRCRCTTPSHANLTTVEHAAIARRVRGRCGLKQRPGRRPSGSTSERSRHFRDFRHCRASIPCAGAQTSRNTCAFLQPKWLDRLRPNRVHPSVPHQYLTYSQVPAGRYRFEVVNQHGERRLAARDCARCKSGSNSHSLRTGAGAARRASRGREVHLPSQLRGRFR